MALKSIDYFGKKFEISYEIVNKDKEKAILFLHGWGSNKELMKQAFSQYFDDFYQIYVDLPGFGNSKNNYILTTKDYANIIQIFLFKTLNLNPQSITIVGHSFGGKVATLLNPKNLVLLSSAGIIEKKPLKVRLKIKLAKILNSLGLNSVTKIFRSKDVEKMDEVMYQTFKNVVDEDFSDIFSSFKNKALIFWGIEDKAVSLNSGKKIASLIKNSKFFQLSGEHYFFLDKNNASFIANTIKELG